MLLTGFVQQGLILIIQPHILRMSLNQEYKTGFISFLILRYMSRNLNRKRQELACFMKDVTQGMFLYTMLHLIQMDR